MKSFLLLADEGFLLADEGFLLTGQACRAERANLALDIMTSGISQGLKINTTILMISAS